MLTLEVIEEVSRLREFQGEWSLFTRTIPTLTPFQLPEWLLTWWSHFGSGKPHVLVFRHDHQIAGIHPCFLHRWNGRRQLTLIGSGISDYLDPVWQPQYSAAILEGLGNHLHDNLDWDICDWQDLSTETPLKPLKPGHRFLIETHADSPCSEVNLALPFEEFLRNRPKGLRRNLRRYGERARAIGPVRFDVSREADAEIMNALIDLHAARWTKTGEAGMIQANGSAEFLLEIAGILARSDMLRLFSLRFNGPIVAAILAFRNASTIFGYLSAFHPEYEHLDFGHALICEALRYSQEQGFCAWNFLRGEEPYKFVWGAQPIPKCRLVIRRNA